jgi:hypothetical protein
MIRSNRCQSSLRSPILCVGGIGLCIGAFLAILTFGAAPPPDPGPTIICGDVVSRGCCSTVPYFSFECSGVLCTSIIQEDGDADYKNIFASGWPLQAFSWQTTYCKYYQAMCDHTQEPPTCIHEDDLSSYSCTDYDPPPGAPTC